MTETKQADPFVLLELAGYQTMVDDLRAVLVAHPELLTDFDLPDVPTVAGVRYVAPGNEPELDAIMVEPASTRPRVIQLGAGDYHRTGPLVWPDVDPVPSIQGYGPFQTRIYWDTDGGTCFQMSDHGTEYVKGIGFRPGTGKPDCWYDNSADTAHDYGEHIIDCFFGDWNTTTGTAAVKLGQTINVFLDRVRFGGGKGPAILAKGQLGTINIDRFTVDSNAAEGQFGGLLQLDYTQGQQMTVRVANGRVECSGDDYAAPRALVRVVGGSGTPALVLLENVQIDLGSITEPHYVFWSDSGRSVFSAEFVSRLPAGLIDWQGGSGGTPISDIPAIWTNGTINAGGII